MYNASSSLVISVFRSYASNLIRTHCLSYNVGVSVQWWMFVDKNNDKLSHGNTLDSTRLTWTCFYNVIQLAVIF